MVSRLTLLFSLVLLLPTTTLLSQNIGVTTFNKRPEKKKRKPPITQEFAFGVRLNSDGWSVIAERGFINRYENRTSFLWMDFSEKKHPKEHKQLNETYAAIFPNQIAPLPFKYGKINNFYQFKAGYGQKRALTGKLDKKNVVVNWTYGVGAAIGFLKPYYLEVQPIFNDPSTREMIKYTGEQQQKDFLNEGIIVGGTFFTQGIGEVKIKPGLAARTGFYFDYTPSETSFLGIEIGTSIEMYPEVIPLMAETNNNSTFVNLYVDIRYGKRWRKDY